MNLVIIGWSESYEYPGILTTAARALRAAQIPLYLQPPSYINSKNSSTELTEGCKAFSFIPVQKLSHRLRTELYFPLVVSLHESKIILLTSAENWQLAMHLPIRVLPRALFLGPESVRLLD